MSDRSDTSEAEATFTIIPPNTTNMRTAGVRKVVSMLNNADSQRSNFNKLVEQLDVNPLPKAEFIGGLEPQNDGIFASPSAFSNPHVGTKQQIFGTEQQVEIAHSDIPVTNEVNKEYQQPRQTFIVTDNGQLQLVPEDDRQYTVLNQETDFAGLLVSIAESIAKLQARVQEQVLSTFGAGINATAPNVSDLQVQAEFQPIDNIEQLFAFEAKLGNKKFVEDFYSKLYSICGPNSNQTGDNAYYKFVDSMFALRLFTLVSGTGQSRAEQKKRKF